MGVGSYDESEQQDRDVESEEENAVSVHENDNEGKVEFDSEASTTELIEKLEGMQDADDV